MIVKPRRSDDLKLMRKSGQISAYALKKVLKSIKPGVNLLDLDSIAEEEILKRGALPSFKTVDGYKWTTCLCVNDELVHGIPRDLVLKMGDIVSVDVGAFFKGWHTDTAWSVVVGRDTNNFLKVGEEALWKAIKQAVEGNFIGDISHEIQSTVEGAGFSVSRNLIGHGVGRALHEVPDVPGIGQKGMGLQLQEGMTLAIEVIYAEKSSDVNLAKDGWTYEIADGSNGGLFEMSVVVGKEKAEVLTDFRRM